MGESYRVAQFVEGGLRYPRQQERYILLLAVKLRAEPMEGDNRASALHAGGTEDILENEDEKVGLSDR
jgi:hypothetical protein